MIKKNVLVLNEPVMSCCGRPRANCECTESLPFSNAEPTATYFGANAAEDVLPLPEPLYLENVSDPVGNAADDLLPLPVMNFAEETCNEGCAQPCSLCLKRDSCERSNIVRNAVDNTDLLPLPTMID